VAAEAPRGQALSGKAPALHRRSIPQRVIGWVRTGRPGPCLPPRRRVKLEIVGDDGDKLTMILEGRVTREKIMQLADLVELYGGGGERSSPSMENKLTRLARLVERRFPYTSFTSRDVVEAYQSEYGEQISLSTASTYLSRLAERGFLERAGGSMNNIRYRLPRERAEEVGDAG
jgi:hypothetical protein